MDRAAHWLEPEYLASFYNAENTVASGVSAVFDVSDGPSREDAQALPADDLLAVLLSVNAQNSPTFPTPQSEHPDSALPFDDGSRSAEATAGVSADLSADANARTEIMDACKTAFALLDENPEHYWARQFLLDHSPHVVAHMLTNPAALAHAASADYYDTLIQSDDKFSGMFDAAKESSYVFIPAFTTGNLVAGIAVTRSAFSKGGVSEALCNEPRSGHGQGHDLADFSTYTFFTGRFVRNVRDNRAIVVSHKNASSHGPPSQTNVWYSQPLAATKFEYAHMTCDGPLFAKDKIIESVRTCIRGCHKRFCPVCGSPPSSSCGCPMPECAGEDVEDASVVYEEQNDLLSEYIGNAKAVVAVPRGTRLSVSYFRADVVSNARAAVYTYKNARHNELATICQSFAVQLSLADRSPALAVMPRAGVTGYAAIAQADIVKGVRSEEPWVTRDSGVSSCEGDRGDTALDWQGNVSSFHGRNCLQSGIERHNEESIQLLDVGVEVADLTNGIEMAKGNAESIDAPARGEAPMSEPGMLPRNVEEGGARPDEESLRRMRKVLRNRAAAARSNARRREKNAALRSGLTGIRQQATELRKRDAELRAENLELRRKLAIATTPGDEGPG